MSDRARYVLDDDQAESIYRRQISPNIFGERTRQMREPRALLINAPDGAGAADLAEQIAAVDLSGVELPEHQYLDHATSPIPTFQYYVIDSSNLPMYHPAYRDLVRAHGELTARALVASATQRWLDSALSEAAQRRVDVIVCHTYTDRDDLDRGVAHLAFPARDVAAYRIEAINVATHPAETLLGDISAAHQRYLLLGSGRTEVDLQRHAASREHCLDISEWFDDHPAITRTGVYRRRAIPHEPSPGSAFDLVADQPRFATVMRPVAIRTKPSRGGPWSQFRFRVPELQASVESGASTRAVLTASLALRWDVPKSLHFATVFAQVANTVRPELHPALKEALASAEQVMAPHIDLPEPAFDSRLASPALMDAVLIFDDLPTVETIRVLEQLASDFGHLDVAVVDPALPPATNQRDAPEPLSRRITDELFPFVVSRQNTYAAIGALVTPEVRLEAMQVAIDQAGLALSITAVICPPLELDPHGVEIRWDSQRCQLLLLTADSGAPEDALIYDGYTVALNRSVTQAEARPRPFPPGVDPHALAPGVTEVLRRQGVDWPPVDLTAVNEAQARDAPRAPHVPTDLTLGLDVGAGREPGSSAQGLG